ncbi:hypothetical protein MMC30_002160 [Trapelia coarctata]|nr:hypothetical protein [Trapelia coarctata]
MTDSPSSHITHTAPAVESLVVPYIPPTDSVRASSLPNGITVDEEEDYTIKCICGFDEDDGRTIYCESCETWQHVDCYYYKKEVPGEQEEHVCADCDRSKVIDARRAADRQRRRREGIEVDRKLKKPPGKSHKKKVKQSDLINTHTNGWAHDRNENTHLRGGVAGNSKDHPSPAKRSKTNHRTTNSMHAQMVPLNTSAHSSKRSTSASHTLQSPSKTPSNNNTPNGYHSEQYSLEFLQLYKDDPGEKHLPANSFNDIKIAGQLSEWSHDIEALTEAANGRTHQDIFMRCEQSLDTLQLPPLQKETKVDESRDYEGLNPTWTYLTINTYIPQNTIVGELRGKIGHMQDYVQDPMNRWEYLRHPLPFVFFHPHLPIYIDTRQEGTNCRYLRRSCNPNLTMKTILENGSDYHFCFVATRDLEAGAELTVGWTLDEHVRTYFSQKKEEIKVEGSTDTDESYVSDWVGKVLADFGGCACDGYVECSMAKYDRRNSTFSGESGIPVANGKHKKGRRGVQHVSSHSTGRTTNSRSGSEAFKHQDDDERDESRSTSVSICSKSNSRDLTPSNHAFAQGGAVGGIELSDREKRKIAALEKTFEEQDKPAAPKRKKRTSGGSTLNTPTTSSTLHFHPFGKLPHGADKLDQKLGTQYNNLTSQPSTPAVASKARYVDSGTSRRNSGSPVSRSPVGSITAVGKSLSNSVMPSPPSPLSRNNYTDSSMQTDPDPETDWAMGDTAQSTPRKPFVSLTKRLLKRCHRERVLLDGTKMSPLQTKATPSPIDDSVAASTLTETSKVHRDSDGDTVMRDGDLQTLPPELSSNSPVEKPRPPDDSPIASDASAPNQTPVLKPPPLPQAWSLPIPSERKQSINGYRTTDLRVQLPPKQLFSGAPTTPSVIGTPGSISSSIAQSPILQTPGACPPLFSVPTSSLVQPSPVKKKLSLGDYMSRKNSHKIDTPTTSTAPPPTAPGSSPTVTHAMLKPLQSTVEEAKENITDGSAVMETPNVEPGDPMEH